MAERGSATMETTERESATIEGTERDSATARTGERESARIAEVRDEEQSRFGTGGAEDLSPRGGDRQPDAAPVQPAPSRGAADWGGGESGPAPGGYGGVERGRGNYDTGAGSNVSSVTFDQLDVRGERGGQGERGEREGREDKDRSGRDDRLKTMPGEGGEGPEALGQSRPIGAVTHGLAETQGLGGTQGVAGSEGSTGTGGVARRHRKDD